MDCIKEAKHELGATGVWIFQGQDLGAFDSVSTSVSDSNCFTSVESSSCFQDEVNRQVAYSKSHVVINSTECHLQNAVASDEIPVTH